MRDLAALAKPQTIVSPGGERIVMMAEADYLTLVELVEDAIDIASHQRFERKLASGEEEWIPSDVVSRLLDGGNPIRVWRDYRGLSAADLAAKADVAPGYLSQLETGKREGTVRTLRKIATALGLTIDDLI